jgi:hypothetical protein
VERKAATPRGLADVFCTENEAADASKSRPWTERSEINFATSNRRSKGSGWMLAPWKATACSGNQPANDQNFIYFLILEQKICRMNIKNTFRKLYFHSSPKVFYLFSIALPNNFFKKYTSAYKLITTKAKNNMFSKVAGKLNGFKNMRNNITR